MQNNENIKLNKKKQSVDEPVHHRNSRTKENSENETTSTKQVKYAKQTKSEAVRHRTFVLSLLTLVLSVLVLALSFTYSQLSASKTATGSITFTLESPAVTYETPLNFKYENGIMTYGLTTDGGTDLSSVPYNITIDSDNILSSYYALVGFQFINASTNAEITSDITFGASPSFGSVAMSALSYDATYNSFVSKTSTAVAKGSKLNLMSYFGIMNLSNLSVTTIKVNVLLILDKSSNLRSVNRTQNTFVANVQNVFVPAPAIFELGSDWSTDFYFYTYPNVNHGGMLLVTSNSNWSWYYEQDAKYDNLTIDISSGYYFKIEFCLNYSFLKNNTGVDVTENGWTWSSNKLYSNLTIDGITYLVEFVNNSNGKTTLYVTSITKSSSTQINFYNVIGFRTAGIYVKSGKDISISKTFSTQSMSSFTQIDVNFYSSNKADNMIFVKNCKVNYGTKYASGCIDGNTKVSTGFNGEYKLAKHINVGDKVLSFNMTTFEWELREVLFAHSHFEKVIYRVELANGSFIELTSGHPIYTRRGWSVCDSSMVTHDMNIYPDILQKQDLQVGDKVKYGDEWIEISKIIKNDEEREVFGYAIDVNHNIVANGILVHNSTA